MKEKDKKLLLKLIVIVAIAIGFLYLFVPSFFIDFSDLSKYSGVENPEKYVKIEYAPFLIHEIAYDFSNSDDPSEYHIYYFLNILKFETGEARDISSPHMQNPDIYYINKSSNFINIFYMSTFLALIIVPILIFYFLYKGFKSIDNKKTKYFLYAGFVNLIVFVFYITAYFYFIKSMDIYNLGYTSFINIGYGFYLVIISIILFFFAYILQNYYIKYQKEKTVSSDNKLNK